MSGGEQKKKGLFGRMFKKTEAETPADEAPAQGATSGETASSGAQPTEKKSWLTRMKDGLSRSSNRLSEGIANIFTKRKLDEAALQELEDILIQADLGVDAATRITDKLAETRMDKSVTPEEVQQVLAGEIEEILRPVAAPLEVDAGHKPHVILMIGVNGSGKTTTIGKLARKFSDEGKTVMLAAGDTFRAAAIEQLQVWGERTGAPVMARDVGADSSGLAYDALETARAQGVDVLMMDTAGRLQNKAHLMDELKKILRVMRKLDENAPHSVVLVLDATTGQNAVSQVEAFGAAVGVTGLIMTKLDGTARGGILVAIARKFGLPVHAIGVGESVEDLQPFAPEEFAQAIINKADTGQEAA